ncbi:MAG: HAD family hydrolase [Candidatus Woesebacteria bacterium]|nr:HAD family hydrolase [Candidatus Woesebacteria bacterium]
MIKFIYFDVGGVVIRDFSGTDKWEDLKRELGIPSDKSQEFEDIYDLYQDEINTNREIDSLIAIYKEKFGIKIPDNYSYLTDGFVKRFEKNLDIWPIIKKAKNKFKIGLLTNIYPHMLEEIKKAGLFPDVEFDQIIDSSIEKVQKPYKAIFELAQKRSGFKGNEILFIDNSKKHLIVPNKLGWQTFYYDSSNINKSNLDLLDFINNL